MTYGFLGAGNMAAAIVTGLIKKGFSPSDIIVYDILRQNSEKLANAHNVKIAENEAELISKVNYLFIAVKPQVGLKLLPVLSGALKAAKPVIISIMAGVSLARMVELLGFEPKLIRIMPNVNAQIGQGITAVCKNNRVTESEYETANEMFKSFGSLVTIPEEQFAVFTALASNSPAFTYLYIDSMARAAVKLGMNKNTALEIAAAAVAGSANMVLAADECPHALIDRVTSPGGTTIEGLCELSERGFETAVTKALIACVEKDAKLGS